MQTEQPRKHHVLALAVLFAAVAFALIFALCTAIDRRLFSSGAHIGLAGAIVDAWMPLFAAFLPILIAIFVVTRKPVRRPNHPRIEHLRIAGKYAPASPSKTGVSPLQLR